jgi:hypothetical protein
MDKNLLKVRVGDFCEPPQSYGTAFQLFGSHLQNSESVFHILDFVIGLTNNTAPKR